MPVGFREFYPIGTPTPQRRLPLKTTLDLIDSSICEVNFVIEKMHTTNPYIILRLCPYIKLNIFLLSTCMFKLVIN